MSTFKSNFPTRAQITNVFGVIVFIVFTWSLYRMTWFLPSWLKGSIQDVLTTSSFVMVFALFESLIILGTLLLFAFLLPVKVYRDTFVPTSTTLLTILACFSVYLLQSKVDIIYQLELRELVLYPILILVAVIILVFLLSLIFNRFESPARIISSIAERMTVFLYIYLPLSILSILIILISLVF